MKNFWITRSTIFCGCSVDLRTQDDRKRCNFLLVHFVSGIMILMLEVCKNGFHFSNRFLHRSLLSALHFIVNIGYTKLYWNKYQNVPKQIQYCYFAGSKYHLFLNVELMKKFLIHYKFRTAIRILSCFCFALFRFSGNHISW